MCKRANRTLKTTEDGKIKNLRRLPATDIHYLPNKEITALPVPENQNKHNLMSITHKLSDHE
jgi:hypothetical protein